MVIDIVPLSRLRAALIAVVREACGSYRHTGGVSISRSDKYTRPRNRNSCLKHDVRTVAGWRCAAAKRVTLA
jgi:hypothetical protein